jgi:hypothetical protein
VHDELHGITDSDDATLIVDGDELHASFFFNYKKKNCFILKDMNMNMIWYLL